MRIGPIDNQFVFHKHKPVYFCLIIIIVFVVITYHLQQQQQQYHVIALLKQTDYRLSIID